MELLFSKKKKVTLLFEKIILLPLAVSVRRNILYSMFFFCYAFERHHTDVLQLLGLIFR